MSRSGPMIMASVVILGIVVGFLESTINQKFPNYSIHDFAFYLSQYDAA